MMVMMMMVVVVVMMMIMIIWLQIVWSILWTGFHVRCTPATWCICSSKPAFIAPHRPATCNCYPRANIMQYWLGGLFFSVPHCSDDVHGRTQLIQHLFAWASTSSYQSILSNLRVSCINFYITIYICAQQADDYFMHIDKRNLFSQYGFTLTLFVLSRVCIQPISVIEVIFCFFVKGLRVGIARWLMFRSSMPSSRSVLLVSLSISIL